MTLSLVLRLLRLLGVSLRSRTTGRSVTRSLAMLVLVRPHLHQQTRDKDDTQEIKTIGGVG